MSGNSKQRTIMAVAIISSVVLMRLVPHIPNFAPMTAAALFGAAYLPKKYALMLPLLLAIVCDYLLLYISPFGSPVFNFSGFQPLGALFHGATLWVWASFMISGLLGLALRKKRNVIRVGGVSLLASLQFYLLTNFGVWAAGAYARDLSGLGQSYIAGLPFLQWTVLGDLFYVASFFGVYALAVNEYEKRNKLTTVQDSI